MDKNIIVQSNKIRSRYILWTLLSGLCCHSTGKAVRYRYRMSWNNSSWSGALAAGSNMWEGGLWAGQRGRNVVLLRLLCGGGGAGSGSAGQLPSVVEISLGNPLLHIYLIPILSACSRPRSHGSLYRRDRCRGAVRRGALLLIIQSQISQKILTPKA